MKTVFTIILAAMLYNAAAQDLAMPKQYGPYQQRTDAARTFSTLF